MPTQLLQRINWSQIYPPLVEKMFDLAAACQARGVDYYAISGYRSFADQAKLYFQGRTKPGDIVTNARPGTSFHNYGLAVDWCMDKDMKREGLQPDYARNSYEVLAEEAEKLGLEPGLRWKFVDAPHVQMRLPDGVKLADLKKIHDADGLLAVWAFLKAKQP